MRHIDRYCALVAVCALLLASCGPGATSSPQNSPTAANDSGGIGGTGKGTITGAGSVILNGVRHFAITDATTITLDDQPITEQELHQNALGMVARVDVATDVNADFTSGTALDIAAENLLKGPVTGVGPLQVLGMTVVVTGDTVLANGVVPAALAVGDLVEVSGYINANNVVQATRLELAPAGLDEWRLTGAVSGLVPGVSFSVGTQSVEYGGVTPSDCGAGLSDGAFVEVKAQPDPGFVPGQPLTTVQSVECVNPGLDIPPGFDAQTLRGEIEGIVDSVALPTFTVSGQPVLVTSSTVFRGGSPADDLIVGARLEVTGTLDVATGVLTAERITFREGRVSILAPVMPGDVVPGVSLTVLGIPMQLTSLTEDEGGLLSGGPPVGGVQLEVHGFVDSAGTVYATEVDSEGAPDPTNVRLKGPVTELPGAPLLRILGVNVDVTGAELQGPEETVLTSSQFFSQLTVGRIVKASGGTYDPGSNTISNLNKVEIDD